MAKENDIVLIYFEEKPAGFARIEEILPDHKPNWYHVKLLLLNVPLQVVTWILRDVYIDGETFTMNGNNMRLEKVVNPETEDESGEKSAPLEPETKKDSKTPKSSSKVISFSDLKKS